MNAISKVKLDKTAISVIDLKDNDADLKAYWISRTPSERLEATELMRQLNYGYNPDTERLQRLLEVVERKRS